MSFSTVTILGIPFFDGKVEDVYEYLKNSGGLLTVPAAPALINIPKDREYYTSLLNSDIVIPDSGLMVLTWNLFSKQRLSKISGLEFMNFFIESLTFVDNIRLMLINPSEEEGEVNLNYLNHLGQNLQKQNLYTAPYYRDTVYDEDLLQKIEEQKPQWIMINIGGGTQEKLGYYLQSNLSYKPAILCTGAAIAFKTGSQVNLPNWADFLYLGWLFRCIHQPKIYIPRYLKGFKLFYLILKYKSNKVT